MRSEQACLLAEYNAWMNGKLYAACATLSDDERKRDRGAFFRSIEDPIDTASPQGKFTLQVLGAAAEFERDRVVGDQAAEALADARQAEDRLAQAQRGPRRAAPSGPTPLGGRRRRRLGAVITWPWASAGCRRP